MERILPAAAAIRAGHAAENAARDNLGSLALTLAAIEAATSGASVTLQALERQ